MMASAYEEQVLQELTALDLSEERKAILRDLVDEGIRKAEQSAGSGRSVSDVMDLAVEALVLAARTAQSEAGVVEFRGRGSLMADQRFLRVLRAALPSWPFAVSDDEAGPSATAAAAIPILAAHNGWTTGSMRPDHERSFNFAQSVVVQLLTVAVAVTTITITFYGDIEAHSNLATRSLLISSWWSFIVSVAFGSFCLLEMTGLVGKVQGDEGIYSKSVRVPAMFQVAFFMIALTLVVIGGALAVA
jgi:hypothetical protein